jgi:hypothetical protein
LTISPGDSVGFLASTELTVSVAWQSFKTFSETMMITRENNLFDVLYKVQSVDGRWQMADSR